MPRLLIAINTAQVSLFGELEYWFALIKVIAILAFIAVGLALVTGVGPGPATGFHNLVDGPGGFLPHGWRGVWLALTLVITSYMGVEVIAVTAGEAEHPETSIPRAMRTMVLRLILFYVLAITVMLMMSPWDQLAEGRWRHHRQPVRARVRRDRHSLCRGRDEPGGHFRGGVERELQSVHDDADAVVAGAIGLRAAIAGRGQRPAACRSAPSRSPAPAWCAAILLAIYAPANAFLALYGTAVAGMLFIWIVILLTYLRFRKALTPEQLARLPIRMPAHRAAAWFGIVSLMAIAATTFFVDGLQYSVPSLSAVPARHVDRLRARRAGTPMPEPGSAAAISGRRCAPRVSGARAGGAVRVLRQRRRRADSGDACSRR